jgi:hypothetical protein
MIARNPLTIRLDEPAPTGEKVHNRRNPKRIGFVSMAPQWPQGCVTVDFNEGPSANVDAFNFCHEWKRVAP